MVAIAQIDVNNAILKITFSVTGIINGPPGRTGHLCRHPRMRQPEWRGAPAAPFGAGRHPGAGRARGAPGCAPDRTHHAPPGAHRGRAAAGRHGAPRAGRLRAGRARRSARPAARQAAHDGAPGVRPAPRDGAGDALPGRASVHAGGADVQRPQPGPDRGRAGPGRAYRPAGRRRPGGAPGGRGAPHGGGQPGVPGPARHARYAAGAGAA